MKRNNYEKVRVQDILTPETNGQNHSENYYHPKKLLNSISQVPKIKSIENEWRCE